MEGANGFFGGKVREPACKDSKTDLQAPDREVNCPFPILSVSYPLKIFTDG